MITNRLFNEFFTNWDNAFFDGDHSYWRRANNNVNWKESEDAYEYKVPLPGFKKESIKATVKDDLVYLRAEQGEDTASYTLLLPDDVDVSKLSATHEDGLLTVRLEKAEKAKPVR